VSWPLWSRAHTSRHQLSSLFACSHLMAGKSINVEGPGYWGGLHQVGDQFVDPWKLFVCVALCILLILPKAQGENLVGFGVRYQNDLIHEPSSAFQDWQDFLLNGSCELSGFSIFGPDGNDSTEHNVPPLVRGFTVRQSLCARASRVNRQTDSTSRTIACPNKIFEGE
jgi:hypothetical protein